MDRAQLKILAIKFLKFIILFLIIDVSFGYVAKRIFFSQESGKFARITYSIEKDHEDILIFGSSHAMRHYVPTIFEEELELSSYNAGVQAQRIIFHNALQKIVLKKRKPKLIILNVDEFWMFNDNEAYDRLQNLHPYYSQYKEEIEPTLLLKSGTIDPKLWLESYKYNSTLVHALKYLVAPQKDYKGYLPLYDKMKKPRDVEKLLKEYAETLKTLNRGIDKNFEKSFQSFILNVKKHKIPIVCVISPTIYSDDYSDNESVKIMRNFLKKEHVDLLDYSQDKNFVFKYELFGDEYHLNDEGAKLFSRTLANDLKNKIDKNEYTSFK